MSTQLNEIQSYLRENADTAGLKAAQKFVPTAQKAYGVRAPKVNLLIPIYQHGGLDLVRELWASGYLEEQILAAKILGKNAKKHPTETLALAQELAQSIQDWAVCDTLAIPALRPLHNKYQKELFDISRRLIGSDKMWVRRFAMVLLEPFCKQTALHAEIKSIIAPTLNEKEHYIKKAVEWLQRELEV